MFPDERIRGKSVELLERPVRMKDFQGVRVQHDDLFRNVVQQRSEELCGRSSRHAHIGDIFGKTNPVL
jgi:hypothetical protein